MTRARRSTSSRPTLPSSGSSSPRRAWPITAAATRACRGYQVWLNHLTGEIRYHVWANAPGGGHGRDRPRSTPHAFTGNNVIVSKNDLNGAYNGTGYKFTPAPPQPMKIYDVDVDPLIEGVVFLQTGYSGYFAPMSVTYP